MGFCAYMDERQAFFQDRTVCVTGAAGSVGRQLLRHLIKLPLRELRALDNDENGLHELTQLYRGEPRVKPVYCDIGHVDQVDRCLRGCELVFHAAAVKHVPGCEVAPWAAVNVNIRGISHVVDAALKYNVERLVFTSSDKAVNPTNVMGASKLVGEKLALASHMSNGRTIIACTRFGNVAGTRGSVIPLFCDQIRRGGPITLTSAEMTRFFMSIADAGSLVINSMMSARHGEIFVTRMQTMRIVDLARVMKQVVAPAYGRIPAGVETVICGLRSGEKLHEELITDEEVRRSFTTRDYIVVMPMGSQPDSLNSHDYPLLSNIGEMSDIYHSGKQEPLDDQAIEEFLLKHDVLPQEVTERTGRLHKSKVNKLLSPQPNDVKAMFGKGNRSRSSKSTDVMASSAMAEEATLQAEYDSGNVAKPATN